MNTTLGKTPGFYLPKVNLEILACAQLDDCSVKMVLIPWPRINLRATPVNGTNAVTFKKKFTHTRG